MLYALNLSDDNRVLSTTYDIYAPAEQPRVETLPEGDVSDYKYIDGQYVYDPLPKPEAETPVEVMNTEQVLTALLTGEVE